MKKNEGHRRRVARLRKPWFVAAWLIIGILLTFAPSAGAELRPAGIGGVHPGSRTASGFKPSGFEPEFAPPEFAPERASRARSISPISPALDDRDSARAIDRDSARERAGHATVSWGTTVFWGTTVDGYISRLASAWEMIREAGDFDFKLGDRTEMKLKLQDLLDNPGALLVVRTAF
jgi:hypothetical protein